MPGLSALLRPASAWTQPWTAVVITASKGAGTPQRVHDLREKWGIFIFIKGKKGAISASSRGAAKSL